MSAPAAPQGSRAGSTGAGLRSWLASEGIRPLPFQEEAWTSFLAGDSRLIHAGTGAGKTLAAAGGALIEAGAGGGRSPGLRLLWITPLRALARDSAAALVRAAEGSGVDWTVELRTGDTSSSIRSRQRSRLPECLVTTPESLSLLLSHPGAAGRFGGLAAVVVDEWHELIGSKRGVLVELLLARLRSWNAGLRVWGTSATLGNPEQAARVLGATPLTGPVGPLPEIESILPSDPVRFPWSGHLGLRLLPAVLQRLEDPGTALLFTNTRAQAEIWHQAILHARPGWAGSIALHHGSLDRAVRESAEEGARAGSLRAVVCTSTLDLGVDFPAVERIFQIGSPRGIGRLIQRAGRSGHRPGGTPRVICVPTHALELLEFAAVRRALGEGTVEPRDTLSAPLDVLAQHLVTLAAGDGFDPEALLPEVRSTHAYRDLTEDRWHWTLDFVQRGGNALRAYPGFRKVVAGSGGIHRVEDPEIARLHRASIGTIVSDADVEVRMLRGARLGTVEESFIARLRPGDHFHFAGRLLEFVRIRDSAAQVRPATGSRGIVPRWAGGRLPISSELGRELLRLIGETGREAPPSPERACLHALLELQARWSRLPDPQTLLVETTTSPEGHHLFLFPFEGRRVHEGLAALLAWRWSRRGPHSIRVSANDLGLELFSDRPLGIGREDWVPLLSPDRLGADLFDCVNGTELARRRFREIARVSGLLFAGYPGRGKSARQLQASGGLLYDVLSRHDPGNLLVEQAALEVLEDTLEFRRLEQALRSLRGRRIVEAHLTRLSPLAFPIWAERMQAEISSESWIDRVRRAAEALEHSARGEERGG